MHSLFGWPVVEIAFYTEAIWSERCHKGFCMFSRIALRSMKSVLNSFMWKHVIDSLLGEDINLTLANVSQHLAMVVADTPHFVGIVRKARGINES